MAKTRRQSQAASPVIRAGEVRELAAQIFARIYRSPASGRNPEHYAAEAIKAAQVFYDICPSLTKE